MVSPETMGQLAMLKVRVRFGTAQKEIEKAFDAAAAALELPRDQIEEMSAPSCGLESAGRRDQTICARPAELAVPGTPPHPPSSPHPPIQPTPHPPLLHKHHPYP